MAVDRETLLYRLNLELHARGVHYTGDSPDDAAAVLADLRKQRQGKPACYGRSFTHDDLTCRQCDEFRQCCRETVYPKFTTEIPDQGLVSCDWCDGDFTVELYGPDGVIVDYACSTDGCRNTWMGQRARRER